MKLVKALKQKSNVAGDVATLTALLRTQNSRSSRQKFDYDASALLAQLRAKINELVEVKEAIARVNTAVQDQIFRLAELKGLAAPFKTLEARHGAFEEGGLSADRLRHRVRRSVEKDGSGCPGC